MSTTIEAAAAATIIQLAIHGFSIDLGSHGMESAQAWTCKIARQHPTEGTRVLIARGVGRYPLVALSDALSRAMSDRHYVAATLTTQGVTSGHGDAWRSLVCIAEDFDFVELTGDGKGFATMRCGGIDRELEQVPIGGSRPTEAIDLACQQLADLVEAASSGPCPTCGGHRPTRDELKFRHADARIGPTGPHDPYAGDCTCVG